MKDGVMTLTKLSRAMNKGFGKGREEKYKSWMRVRRNYHSTVSKLYVMHTPLYVHGVHLLAGTEYEAANMGLWLGATEMREQRPAWPDEHAHPASGLHPDLDRKYQPVRGLLEVAKDLGVDHGVYVGTRIPFVATIDLTLGVGPWQKRRLVDWSCKPKEILESAANRERMLERIELERAHSKDIGSMHILIDGTQWSKELADNVNWFRPLNSEFTSEPNRALLEDFAGHFMAVAESASIFEATSHCASLMKLTDTSAGACFRAAAWLGHIDLDFSRPIVMTRRLNRDVTGLKRRLRNELLGAEA